ncbi:MAG: Hypothetical Nudix-like regulator, partial [uncultured Nocardioidaceae bacterium]
GVHLRVPVRLPDRRRGRSLHAPRRSVGPAGQAGRSAVQGPVGLPGRLRRRGRGRRARREARAARGDRDLDQGQGAAPARCLHRSPARPAPPGHLRAVRRRAARDCGAHRRRRCHARRVAAGGGARRLPETGLRPRADPCGRVALAERGTRAHDAGHGVPRRAIHDHRAPRGLRGRVGPVPGCGQLPAQGHQRAGVPRGHRRAPDRRPRSTRDAVHRRTHVGNLPGDVARAGPL